MNKQAVLTKLVALKVILDRLSETDTTLHEALSLDVEEASRLTDECIEELAADNDGSE